MLGCAIDQTWQEVHNLKRFFICYFFEKTDKNAFQFVSHFLFLITGIDLIRSSLREKYLVQTCSEGALTVFFFFLPYFMKPTSELGLKLKNVPKSPKNFLSKEMMRINLLLIPARFVRKNLGKVVNLEG